MTHDGLLRDKVIYALRSAILCGDLKPGRRITENELTERTGVSRTSVREAVRVLQTERLLEPSSSRGVQVPMPTLEEAESIYEIRALIEPAVARMFCERASDEDIAALREAFENYQHCSIHSGVLGPFDEIFFARCGNPILKDVIEPLYARVFVLRNLALQSSARGAASTREYLDLIEAIEARAPTKAAAAARRHVEAARAFALKALKDHPEWRVAIMPRGRA